MQGFPRAAAYVALYPYLTRLVLPMGVGNLAANRPAEDVTLVASKATLAVRRDLHPVLQYLLVHAAMEIHGRPGILRSAGQFPSAVEIDLPLSGEARHYSRPGLHAQDAHTNGAAIAGRGCWRGHDQTHLNISP